MSSVRMTLIIKIFIESQFNHCPLLWMFHNRKLNNRINKLHKRALWPMYEEDDQTFEHFLKKFTIHERNLQKLAILMNQVKSKMCHQSVQEIFVKRFIQK